MIKILVFNYTVAAVSGIVLTFLTSSYAIVALFTMFVFFAGVNVPVVNSAAVDIFPTYLRYAILTYFQKIPDIHNSFLLCY